LWYNLIRVWITVRRINVIRVTVDTIRLSLKSSERVVLLRENEQERQLPIFIHATEADAIAAELKSYHPPRPLTHDLLKSTISALGGELQYVLINDLRESIFYAVLHIEQGDRTIDVDARPSDSIALAVRTRCPIYVADHVMEIAGVFPSKEVETAPDQQDLSVFRDFVETLDLGES
jgi:bifunctional DNase/RNase